MPFQRTQQGRTPFIYAKPPHPDCRRFAQIRDDTALVPPLQPLLEYKRPRGAGPEMKPPAALRWDDSVAAGAFALVGTTGHLRMAAQGSRDPCRMRGLACAGPMRWGVLLGLAGRSSVGVRRSPPVLRPRSPQLNDVMTWSRPVDQDPAPRCGLRPRRFSIPPARCSASWLSPGGSPFFAVDSGAAGT